ncbi:hypothetical protein C8Q80DRAFT_1120584 [Daedaleopsis nitida]|nr:hypothetical protein C8Q80DRAFT_1120584 [Daedaleopsis nitida]
MGQRLWLRQRESLLANLLLYRGGRAENGSAQLRDLSRPIIDIPVPRATHFIGTEHLHNRFLTPARNQVDDVPTTSSANDFPVNTQPSTTQSPTSSSSSSSPNVGAIVGGVIGGVALLALAAAAFLFLRRHKKRHAAPSAEFMHMARGASPTFSAKHVEASAMSMNGDHMPLARHSSIEEEDPPPAFSPGSFKDPVFEKVSASAAMREQYEARDAEGGYKD